MSDPTRDALNAGRNDELTFVFTPDQSRVIRAYVDRRERDLIARIVELIKTGQLIAHDSRRAPAR